MRYSQDDFLELDEAVEAHGGRALPTRCEPHKFRLKQPKPGVEFDGTGRVEKKDMHWKTFTTAACMQDALFALPYEVDPAKAYNEPGFATVCAVDDAMGLWPRFELDLEDSWLDGPVVPDEWEDA